ncbi:MAG: outer membrane protein OmpA-like peptidoglycan-associated protein, partial [Maribacter sp.]
MRKRKVTTLFAVSFLLVFGKQNADAADSTNYSSDSSNTQGDMFHYGFNYIYPNNQDLVYLRRMVMRMKKDHSLKLKITSHGCAIGTDDVNMKVSRLRANILEDYMMRHDISRARIIKEWKGESEPMADNETESGRRVNRRSLVQLVRTSGDIAEGINKPQGQIYRAKKRKHITSNPTDLYANNSYVPPSSSSSPSKYSTPKIQQSSTPNYVSSTPSNKIHRSEPVQPSSYNNATNNSHIQHNNANMNDQGDVYSSNNSEQNQHSQYPTEQPLVKPNPNAVYNNQQDITSSPPRKHQQNTVVPNVPAPSVRPQSPDYKEENKDYVDIDVQQVYEDINSDLGAKGDDTNAPNANDNSANVEKYNQVADAFSPDDSNTDLPIFKPNDNYADIEKYNQLADALENDDADDVLFFTEEPDLISKSDGAMVHDDNVMNTNDDVESYKGKKVNQKPRPILVSEKMEERN